MLLYREQTAAASNFFHVWLSLRALGPWRGNEAEPIFVCIGLQSLLVFGECSTEKTDLVQDADEDMKNMAARTPAKDGEMKVEPRTPGTKRRRKGESRLRRRLFDTPKQDSPSPTDRSPPGSQGDDSEEDGDLWQNEFRRQKSTSLPEKRKALNRPSSRSKVKKRRAGSSPGAPSAKSEITAAPEVPGESFAENDDEEGSDKEPSPVPMPKPEPTEAKPEEAPLPEGPSPAIQVESDVLQSLPKGLSE